MEWEAQSSETETATSARDSSPQIATCWIHYIISMSSTFLVMETIWTYKSSYSPIERNQDALTGAPF